MVVFRKVRTEIVGVWCTAVCKICSCYKIAFVTIDLASSTEQTHVRINVVRFQRLDSMHLLTIQVDSDFAGVEMLKIKRVASERTIKCLIVYQTNNQSTRQLSRE